VNHVDPHALLVDNTKESVLTFAVDDVGEIQLDIPAKTLGDSAQSYVLIDKAVTQIKEVIAPAYRGNQTHGKESSVTYVPISDCELVITAYSEFGETIKSFKRDLLLSVPYQDSGRANVNENTIALFALSDEKAPWIRVDASRVDGEKNIVSSPITYSARYAVLGAPQAPLSDLSLLKVYPNPYKPSSGGIFDAPSITFTNLTEQITIKIYTIAGELVWDLNEAHTNGEIQWNATNNHGETIASGVYLYLVTNDAGQKKTGKIAVVK
jgi:hypothetical protein